jgi:hypothetical protein
MENLGVLTSYGTFNSESTHGEIMGMYYQNEINPSLRKEVHAIIVIGRVVDGI